MAGIHHLKFHILGAMSLMDQTRILWLENDEALAKSVVTRMNEEDRRNYNMMSTLCGHPSLAVGTSTASFLDLGWGDKVKLLVELETDESHFAADDHGEQLLALFLVHNAEEDNLQKVAVTVNMSVRVVDELALERGTEIVVLDDRRDVFAVEPSKTDPGMFNVLLVRTAGKLERQLILPDPDSFHRELIERVTAWDTDGSYLCLRQVFTSGSIQHLSVIPEYALTRTTIQPSRDLFALGGCIQSDMFGRPAKITATGTAEYAPSPSEWRLRTLTDYDKLFLDNFREGTDVIITRQRVIPGTGSRNRFTAIVAEGWPNFSSDRKDRLRLFFIVRENEVGREGTPLPVFEIPPSERLIDVAKVGENLFCALTSARLIVCDHAAKSFEVVHSFAENEVVVGMTLLGDQILVEALLVEDGIAAAAQWSIFDRVVGGRRKVFFVETRTVFGRRRSWPGKCSIARVKRKLGN